MNNVKGKKMNFFLNLILETSHPKRIVPSVSMYMPWLFVPSYHGIGWKLSNVDHGIQSYKNHIINMHIYMTYVCVKDIHLIFCKILIKGSFGKTWSQNRLQSGHIIIPQGMMDCGETNLKAQFNHSFSFEKIQCIF